jgi:hypothetical protein
MEKLISYATRFIQKMDVKDMAFLKFCLLAVGVMLGVCVPKKHKKLVLTAAVAIFIATYIPIMGKFIQGYLED